MIDKKKRFKEWKENRPTCKPDENLSFPEVGSRDG